MSKHTFQIHVSVGTFTLTHLINRYMSIQPIYFSIYKISDIGCAPQFWSGVCSVSL